MQDLNTLIVIWGVNIILNVCIYGVSTLNRLKNMEYDLAIMQSKLNELEKLLQEKNDD